MTRKRFAYFVWTTSPTVQQEKSGFNEPSAKCAPMKNALVTFPGDKLAPPTVHTNQIKIPNVVCSVRT